MRTRADFKALRETLGISQLFIADALGVNIKSAKRWEKPNEEGWYEPPEEAWELLEKYQEIQRWQVQEALSIVEEQASEHGEPNRVQLTYWRSQEEFERAHPNDKGDYQMANATARMIAHVLYENGYECDFNFPGLHEIIEGA